MRLWPGQDSVILFRNNSDLSVRFIIWYADKSPVNSLAPEDRVHEMLE